LIPQIACAAVKHGGYVFRWLPDSMQENEFISCIITQGTQIPNIHVNSEIPFGPDNDKFSELKKRIRDRKSFRAVAKTIKRKNTELPDEIVSKIRSTIGGTKRTTKKRKGRSRRVVR